MTLQSLLLRKFFKFVSFHQNSEPRIRGQRRIRVVLACDQKLRSILTNNERVNIWSKV